MDNTTIIKEQRLDSILSTEDLQRFHVIMTGFWIGLCLSGIVSNVLNLRTFIVMGLEDSVSVSFFCLAVSDFSICSIAFVEMIAFLAFVLEREYDIFFYLPPLVTTLYMMCLRRTFNTTTVLITTFLAVQRCLCVVFPFHVKGMFTRFRTICFMLVILTFSLTCHSLYMWRHEVVEIMNLAHNKSQLILFVPSGSEPYLYLMEVLIGIFLNVANQVVIVACLIIMGVSLWKSVQFRQSTTRSVTSKPANASDNVETPKSKDNSNSKEIQAMKQVFLVAIIFIITNSPYLAFGIANLLIPGYGVNQTNHNLFHLGLNIMFTAELLNSSVNFIVYYNYNTKFRLCFQGKIK